MKPLLILIAVSGLALLVSSAHAANDASIAVDSAALEVKTSLGQNNAYRVILGKLNDSPVCQIEKWGYQDKTKNLEKKINTWDCKSVSGGDGIGNDPSLTFSELREVVNGFEFKATKYHGGDFITHKSCTIDPYKPPEVKVSCSTD